MKKQKWKRHGREPASRTTPPAPKTLLSRTHGLKNIHGVESEFKGFRARATEYRRRDCKEVTTCGNNVVSELCFASCAKKRGWCKIVYRTATCFRAKKEVRKENIILFFCKHCLLIVAVITFLCIKCAVSFSPCRVNHMCFLFLTTLQPHGEATLPPQDATTFCTSCGTQSCSLKPMCAARHCKHSSCWRSLKEGTPTQALQKRQQRRETLQPESAAVAQKDDDRPEGDERWQRIKGEGGLKGRRNRSTYRKRRNHGRERQRAIVRRPVPQAVALPSLSKSA